MPKLQIIQSDLLQAYLTQVSNLHDRFDVLKDAEISTKSFSFYTSVASVYSSKIEGEDIELDSYIKHKGMGISFKPDYTKKTDDLYDAYLYAQKNKLNPDTIAEAHKLLAKNLVDSNFLGKFRNQNMYVTSEDGRIDYVAVSPFDLKNEMEKFYQDIYTLLKQRLSIEEVFYYASFIHLVFVKIHPWNDGNGRSARLIEKWFIAEHLGEKAWFMQSEKYYYLQHKSYYQHLRKLGMEYPSLDYAQSLPFLFLLPKCLEM